MSIFGIHHVYLYAIHMYNTLCFEYAYFIYIVAYIYLFKWHTSCSYMYIPYMCLLFAYIMFQICTIYILLHTLCIIHILLHKMSTFCFEYMHSPLIHL